MNVISLPGELRNAIYDQLSFPHHDTVQVINCTQPQDLVESIFNSPIFRINRKIRTEALSRLFRSKTISLSDFVTAHTFLAYVGTVAQDNITHLVISSPVYIGSKTFAALPVWKLLRDLRALKTLDLKLTQKPIGSPSGVQYPWEETNERFWRYVNSTVQQHIIETCDLKLERYEKAV